MKTISVNRTWAMPSKDTMSIKPIREFTERHLHGLCVDPFAGNSLMAMLRNDLNPNTSAIDHMDAIEWLKRLPSDYAMSAIVDPPYSPRQMKECYESIGLNNKGAASTQNARLYAEARQELNRILKQDATVIWLGWSSVGMTESLGWKMVDGLVVCHGGGHNDTIATAWRRNNEL